MFLRYFHLLMTSSTFNSVRLNPWYSWQLAIHFMNYILSHMLRHSILLCWSHLTFFWFLGFLASPILPNWSGDLNYGPCPPARDWGSRVSGLILRMRYSCYLIKQIVLSKSCISFYLILCMYFSQKCIFWTLMMKPIFFIYRRPLL